MNRIFAAFILPALAMHAAAGEPAIKGITVNDEKVSAEFIKRYYDRFVYSFKAAGRELQPQFMERLAQNAKQRAAQQVALRQYVEKNKLAAPPEAIQEELEASREQLGSRGINVAEMLKASGETEDDLKKEVAPVAAVMQSVKGGLDTAKLKESFEKEKERIPARRVSHILYMHSKSQRTSQPDRKQDDAKRLADQALERINKGDDFAAIAGTSSDCPSKSKGGDLGWFMREMMVKPFSDASFAMNKIGDTSGIVETDFGYHIIRLTGVRTDEDKFKFYVRQECEKQLQKVVEQATKDAKVADQ